MLGRIFVGLCVLVCMPALAGGGIEFFEGSFEQAVARAGKEGKMVFVDVYADWCAPCKRMARTVFMQDDVGGIFNRHFVSYKLNAENEAQNGPEITRRFEATPFPTYLFLDASGKVRLKHSGAMGSEAFKTLALSAVGTVKDTAAFCKAYESGNRSIGAFLSCFSRKDFERRAQYKPATTVQETMAEIERSTALKREYQAYFNTVPEQSLLTAEGFKLITNAPDLERGEAHTEFLVQHYEQFAQVVDRGLLAKTLVEANTSSLVTSAVSGKSGDWVEDIRGVLADAYAIAGSGNGLDAYEREKARRESGLAMQRKDWPGFIAAKQRQAGLETDPVLRTKCMSDIGTLMIINSCDDTRALQVGAAYMALVLDQGEAFNDLLIYGQLLTKVGETDTALRMVERARLMLAREPEGKSKTHRAWQLERVVKQIGTAR